jgi:hypothetical protein
MCAGPYSQFLLGISSPSLLPEDNHTEEGEAQVNRSKSLSSASDAIEMALLDKQEVCCCVGAECDVCVGGERSVIRHFCCCQIFLLLYFYYYSLSPPCMSYNIYAYTILYYTILYYTILYYTILYYTILYRCLDRGILACPSHTSPHLKRSDTF